MPSAHRCDSIGGLPDGSYTVRPFDTWAGNALEETSAQSSSGEMTITLPAFRNDIALKLVRKL